MNINFSMSKSLLIYIISGTFILIINSCNIVNNTTLPIGIYVVSDIGDIYIIYPNESSDKLLLSTNINTLFDIAISKKNNSILYGITPNSIITINLDNNKISILDNSIGGNALTFLNQNLLVGINNNEVFIYDLYNKLIKNSFYLSNSCKSSGDLALFKGILYASVNCGNTTDYLMVLDLNNKSTYIVGNIKFSGVYGLSVYDDKLFGFTINGLLININTTTGEGTYLRNLSFNAHGSE